MEGRFDAQLKCCPGGVCSVNRLLCGADHIGWKAVALFALLHYTTLLWQAKGPPSRVALKWSSNGISLLLDRPVCVACTYLDLAHCERISSEE